MPLAFLCALALSTDAWTLKPPLAAGTKATWNVSVEAETDQGNHSATFDLIEEAKTGTSDKGQPVHISIANLLMEGNPAPTMESDGIVNSQNVLLSMGDDDATRRMFAPLIFDYPAAPVSVGDTWKSEVAVKDAPKISYDYTAKQLDSSSGTDMLQVEAKVKEAGDDGLSATETWWLNKAGNVVKFKIKVVNWKPTAAGGQAITATLTGKLKA